MILSIKKTSFLIILILSISYAESYSLDPIFIKDEILQSSDFVLNHSYDSAKIIILNGIKKSPENPLYNFYMVLIYESMMIDYETEDFKNEYDSFFVETESSFLNLLKKDSNNVWLNIYLGNLYVTAGAHSLRFSKLIDFTKNVRKGISFLEKAKEMDSTIVDSYLYLGMYKYAKAQLFGWVIFWRKDKELAISYIDKAQRKSILSRSVSKQVLIGLLGHYGNIELAEKHSIEFLEKYPLNRTVRWLMANSYKDAKMYKKSFMEFKKLLVLVDSIPEKYFLNSLVVRLELAELAYKLNKQNDALLYCKEIQSFNKENSANLEIQNIYKNNEQLISKILKENK